MRSLPTVALLLLLVAACSQESGRADDGTSAQKFKEICTLSVREVLPNGTISRNEIIRAEHVLRVDAGPFEDEDEVILQVTLDARGSERLHSHSSASIGRELATFCGDTEVSRATILAPASGHFLVRVPIIADGT